MSNLCSRFSSPDAISVAGIPEDSYSSMKSSVKRHPSSEFKLSIWKSGCSSWEFLCHVSNPILNNVNKETKAGILGTSGNHADVCARGGWEREKITLHRLLKSEPLEGVPGLHISSSVKDTNSDEDTTMLPRSLSSRSEGFRRIET
jgi:hypothetical protein